MAIKKRWLEALEEAARSETVRLPWTRGTPMRQADATPARRDDGPEGAPA
jgi:hypothetical protein